MKKITLEKMAEDGTLSEIQRMACGSLIETRKKNSHRDLPAAAANLGHIYATEPWDNRLGYVTDMAEMADDREWAG